MIPGLGLLQKIGLGVGLLALVATGGYLKGRYDGKALTDAAVERALSDARETTEKAINELADEADRARVRRRLCVESGGVWSFANNECIKASAKP